MTTRIAMVLIGTFLVAGNGWAESLPPDIPEIFETVEVIDLACIPECAGKECGPDGCGSICGQCAEGEVCSDDGLCEVSECGHIGFTGCCKGPSTLVYCDEGGKRVEVDCAAEGWPPFCGWDPESEFYDCGVEGKGSDDAEFPYSCIEPCVPDCKDRACGPDGCGNLCGTCADGEFCDEAGKCQEEDCGNVTFEGCCEPDGTLKYCEGNKLQTLSCGDPETRFCGWNAHEEYYDCLTDGLAEPTGKIPYSCSGTCAPNCAGKQCGPDGCGKTCGTCAAGEYCDDGVCKKNDCGTVTEIGCCEPDGTLKYCDGGKSLVSVNCGVEAKPSCGWNADDGWYDCGTEGAADPSGNHPYACGGGCTASCEGKKCGSDGCVGSCGICPADEICSPDGLCVKEADECGDIPEAGCCDGETLKFCAKGKVSNLDCMKEGKVHCGWSEASNGYVCGTDGQEDPTGKMKKPCPGASMTEPSQSTDILAPESVSDPGQQTTGEGVIDSGQGNAGKTQGSGGGGCATSRGSAMGPAALLLVFILGVLSIRRRWNMCGFKAFMSALVSVGHLVGCEPETLVDPMDDEGDDIDFIESAASGYHYIQMVQKGAFDNTLFFMPTQLLWGLVKKPGDPWESPQTVQIAYSKSGTKLTSKALKIKIPKAKLNEGYIVAYKLKMERVTNYSGSAITHYTTERYIKNPLSVKTGTMVVLPLKAWTCYTGGFYDWNYHISVYDEAVGNCSTFWGKPLSYFWGLTTIDAATYKSKGPAINFDFPWYDNVGGTVLDGWDDTFSFQHDGGYKGCYRSSEAIVWVPSGWNLLFKTKFAKYWDTKVVETPDTKAFFISPSAGVPKCN